MTDKRKKILCIVGALLSVLLIAGAGIWGLASRNAPEEDSAVQEVMSHIREKDYMRALYIYNMQVKQEENGTQKMETLMQEYIAELDSEYRSGRIILSDYTERCGQMLNIRRTSALVDQIQTQLTALMNERYTQYMSVKDTDDGTAYSKAETVFRVVLDSELDMTFWDAEEKRSHMKAINDSRYAYETGLLYEQKATYSDYIKALESYKQVHKDSPRYSEAQTAITRCSNAFREMTLYILEVHYSNPDIYSYQSGLIWGLKRIEDDLKVLPDDAVLTAKYTEWKQLLVADVRSEADKALADKDMRYWDKWTKITQALTYVPDDEKLLAAKASLIEPMKQEFCKELRWHMGDLEWSYCDRISDLAQRIPGDPEAQQLYDAARRYLSNKLNNFLENKQNIKFLYYPRRMEEEMNGSPLFRNDPVTDRHGVKHDPFNLYRVTASVGSPASFQSTEWNADNGLKQLSFTVDAAAGCGTGSAVIEVYTYDNTTQADAPKTKIYTSPVLNRKTQNLKIEVDLNGAKKIEVRVVAKSGSVTLLWDHAYLMDQRIVK